MSDEESMSKSNSSTQPTEEMRSEYDFRNGVRGKHAKVNGDGVTITIHHEDGTTTVQEVAPHKGTVLLEPDVLAYFPDAEAVNHALRTLTTLCPDRQPSAKP